MWPGSPMTRSVRRSCETLPPTAPLHGYGWMLSLTILSHLPTPPARLYIKSDGTPWRPIVHIRDIIAAMRAVLGCPAGSSSTTRLSTWAGRRKITASRELATIVAETVPGCRVEYAPDGGPDKRCYRVNCDKIRSVLPGFRPEWTARRGAQELYDAYRTAELTAADDSAPLHTPEPYPEADGGRPAGCIPALDSGNCCRRRFLEIGELHFNAFH